MNLLMNHFFDMAVQGDDWNKCSISKYWRRKLENEVCKWFRVLRFDCHLHTVKDKDWLAGNICMTDELRDISFYCLVFGVYNFKSGFIEAVITLPVL